MILTDDAAKANTFLARYTSIGWSGQSSQFSVSNSDAVGNPRLLFEKTRPELAECAGCGEIAAPGRYCYSSALPNQAGYFPNGLEKER